MPDSILACPPAPFAPGIEWCSCAAAVLSISSTACVKMPASASLHPRFACMLELTLCQNFHFRAVLIFPAGRVVLLFGYVLLLGVTESARTRGGHAQTAISAG